MVLLLKFCIYIQMYKIDFGRILNIGNQLAKLMNEKKLENS